MLKCTSTTWEQLSSYMVFVISDFVMINWLCWQQCGRQCRSISGMRYHYARCGNITCSLCKRTFTVMAKFNAHHVLFHGGNLSSKVLHGNSPSLCNVMSLSRTPVIQGLPGTKQGMHYCYHGDGELPARMYRQIPSIENEIIMMTFQLRFEG